MDRAAFYRAILGIGFGVFFLAFWWVLGVIGPAQDEWVKNAVYVLMGLFTVVCIIRALVVYLRLR